jgi:hypothetical protein
MKTVLALSLEAAPACAPSFCLLAVLLLTTAGVRWGGDCCCARSGT